MTLSVGVVMNCMNADLSQRITMVNLSSHQVLGMERLMHSLEPYPVHHALIFGPRPRSIFDGIVKRNSLFKDHRKGAIGGPIMIKLARTCEPPPPLG